MCLAIPGRILRWLDSPASARIAEVDFAGQLKPVNMLYLPEAQLGDFVVVHAGFATSRLEEREAREALEYVRQIRELSTPPTGAAASSPSPTATA
jgi:hydrogenase expression/formation protein HypC